MVAWMRETRIVFRNYFIHSKWPQDIADNGKGVPFEFKDQLFELLSSTKQTGMGLGLWLCKHIITRYGGTINYEDTIGSGAKFVITLPSAV